MRFFLTAAGALALLVALAACGDDDASTGSTPESSRSAAPSASPTRAPGTTASSAPTLTPLSTAPAATSSPAPDDAERAFEAALRAEDGAPDTDCVALQKTCIVSAELANGIALFHANEPMGGGYLMVMAKDAQGEWHFWYGTQHAVTPPLRLPDDMRVCTGGAGLNVRAEPDASAQLIQTLADETVVRGEEFVLTEPGIDPHAWAAGTHEENFGNGWYRISSPVEGWVYSPYVYLLQVSEDCGGLPWTWLN